MQKLDAKEITPQEAQAQSSLAKQANNVLTYELKRTFLQMQMQRIGANIEISDISLRNIESKPLVESNFPNEGYPKS